MTGRFARIVAVGCWCSLAPALACTSRAQAPAPIDAVVVKDWRHDVTPTDLGFNALSGNVGAVNKDGLDYARTALECPTPVSCALRVSWDFRIAADLEAFTGYFLSLAGLTSTRATFDGRTIEDVAFPHALDLDNVLGPVGPADGPRRATAVVIDLEYDGARPLTLRLELQDAAGRVRFARFRLLGMSRPRQVVWSFRATGTSSGDVDFAGAKVLSIVIERRNLAAGVVNPDDGALVLRRVSLRLDRPVLAPTTDEEMLEETERYALQHFLTWYSRAQSACTGHGPDGTIARHEPGSYGFALDRSTFADLITAGGTGFALPAYVIAAERRHLPRTDAAALTLAVLRVLADPAAFGPERIGRIGHRGFLYHFLGCDGRRKLNFDFPDTSTDESLNTVELSVIDTGLMVAGALVAQEYFNGASVEEAEIRRLAQDVYDRVDWPFMLEPQVQRFYLGWKPLEPRVGPSFEVPDAAGLGHYSGTPDRPATLDYFTDEALLVILLAAGSRTAPVAVPADLYCSLIRARDNSGLVRSWPGSLFTYFFLHAFVDTREALFPACPGETQPFDWHANSRRAFAGAMAFAEENSCGFPTYGPNAWGFSAAEGFDDAYRAYAVPPLAITDRPDQDGTVTYYGMASAVSFGGDWRERAIAALRGAWERAHWHPVSGPPDAFNDDICHESLCSTVTCAGNENLLRAEGPWVQTATFAIDQGPILLHLENARSGLVWRLFRENANVRRAVDRLRELPSSVPDPPPAPEPPAPTPAPPQPAPDQITLEGESGSGAGQVMPRSNASGARTVWLHDGETRVLTFDLPSPGRYGVSVRYSNDNFGATERVEVSVDGRTVGSFDAEDTGDGGFGWDVFRWADVATLDLAEGAHRIDVTPRGGDGYGIELDVVRLSRQ